MSRTVGVIGRREMVMPYKMMGFDVTYVEDQTSFLSQLDEWISTDRYAIIYVETYFYQQLEHTETYEMMFLPAVVSIPSFEEGSDSTEQIEKMVEQAIGKKIM